MYELDSQDVEVLKSYRQPHMDVFLNICVFSGVTIHGTLYHYNTKTTHESDSYKSQISLWEVAHQFWCMLPCMGELCQQGFGGADF